MPKGSSRHCKGPENAGLSVALDDFGTGYAALTHLKALPINRIKIDKPFVRDTKLDQEDAAIVSATVGLAHALSLGVVAEGVESPEQAQFLHACGCDVIQCFPCGPPAPASALAAALPTIIGKTGAVPGETVPFR